MAVFVHLYDSGGVLIFEAPAGTALAAVKDFSLSYDPWNPSDGALVLGDGGAWVYSYDGLDGSGSALRNGVYQIVVESKSGGASSFSTKYVRVVGSDGARVSLLGGPNPVRPGQAFVQIRWLPPAALELKIYSLDGQLVRDFGNGAISPATWDLRSAGGEPVADGIYVILARKVGERGGQMFKLMVAR